MDFLYLLEGLRNPVLDKIMLTVTTLGEETVFLVLSLYLLWCVDKYYGYFMLSVGFIGTQLNQMLKVIFKIDRPWVRDPSFTIVEGSADMAAGYSFPSGHTQSATGCFGAVARWTKNNILRIVSIIIIALVAFSRMYLGVHTPADVIVSLVIGAILIFALYPLIKKAKKNYKVMYCFIGIMLLWSILQILFMEFFPFSDGLSEKELYSSLKNAYKMAGAVSGFAVMFELDRRYIKFETKAVWWAQIIKLVGGLSLTIAVKNICYAVFGLIPYEPFSRFLSYFFMVLFATCVWPLTFRFFSKLDKNKR
ncbi:MAG: phosphatase PAP2 family protein [Clostridia bacterium]|nr:phosphatase PAP2 family protein [Clostridia bacterium]MEE1025077.1 phosphatase PAP2 family protein [Acutalibacteraceae bacterium]